MLEIAEHYLPFAALSRLHADQPLHAVCRRRDTCGSVGRATTAAGKMANLTIDLN
jgi:hypothetical protein